MIRLKKLALNLHFKMLKKNRKKSLNRMGRRMKSDTLISTLYVTNVVT